MAALYVKKRVHIQGLSETIRPEEIQRRFCPFGTVSCIELVPYSKEQPHLCRGFGYFELETDASLSQWHKALSVYNGAEWRGKTLRLEEAQPRPSPSLLQSEEEKPLSSRKLLKKMKYVRHAKDLSICVTDKNMDEKKAWRRGRYGRAIRIMRVRLPNRQFKLVDPSTTTQTCLSKLFGSEKPLPIDKLNWRYHEEEENTSDKEEIRLSPPCSGLFSIEPEEDEKIGETKIPLFLPSPSTLPSSFSFFTFPMKTTAGSSFCAWTLKEEEMTQKWENERKAITKFFKDRHRSALKSQSICKAFVRTRKSKHTSK